MFEIPEGSAQINLPAEPVLFPPFHEEPSPTHYFIPLCLIEQSMFSIQLGQFIISVNGNYPRVPQISNPYLYLGDQDYDGGTPRIEWGGAILLKELVLDRLECLVHSSFKILEQKRMGSYGL